MARVISDETSLSRQRRGLQRETILLRRIMIGEGVIAALMLAWGLFMRVTEGTSGWLWAGGVLAFLAVGHWMKSRDNVQQEGFLNAGQKGEAEVATALARELDNSFYVLNDIHVRSGFKKSQIDHLVVGPTGVFVIETKNWRGRIAGAADEKSWTQRKYDDQPLRRVTNPILQNERHVQVLRSLLSSAGIEGLRIASFIVFTSRHVTLDISGEHDAILWPHELAAAIRKPAAKPLAERDIDAVLHRLKRFM